MEEIIKVLTGQAVLLMLVTSGIAKVYINRYFKAKLGIDSVINKYTKTERPSSRLSQELAESIVNKKVEDHIKAKGYGTLKRVLIGNISRSIKRKLQK